MVEQRKSKRFNIKAPVRIVRSGLRPLIGDGETRNLSSAGVLFVSDTKVDVGEAIEYVITLSQGGEPNLVNLHCLGKVTRMELPSPPTENGNGPFEVAATLERYEFVRKERL